ncbi:MAG: hypothetical protein WCT42_02805 [Candidatus Paceibacterota bacterium]
MTKIQKIWLGGILFLVLLVPIVLYFEGNDIYIKNQNLVFFELVIEIIGLFILLNFNNRFNKMRYKNLIKGLLILIIIFVSFILYFLFSLRHGIGF